MVLMYGQLCVDYCERKFFARTKVTIHHMEADYQHKTERLLLVFSMENGVLQSIHIETKTLAE